MLIKYTGLFLTVFMLFAAAYTVRAADGGYDGGYIVQVDESCEYDARLFCVPDKNVISEKLGVYYAADEKELEYLCETRRVTAYERDVCAQLFDVPDDELYPKRWDAPALKLPHVWDYDLNMGGVTVAIIDSGLAPAHADIDYGNVELLYDVTTGTSGKADDKVNHGTSVAGIIGAKRGNGAGAFGVADGVKLKIFKVVPDGTTDAPFSKILAALVYICENEPDVDVVNMSLGGVPGDIVLKKMSECIDTLVSRGVIVTAAAGNSGDYRDENGDEQKEEYEQTKIMYPAGCEGVIGAGSVGSGFVHAPSSQRNESVFVSAPGVGVYTTTMNGGYASRSGTSFSAPYTAAVAALVKAADKSIGYDGFAALLRETALDMGDEGYDTSYGWGVIQPSLIMDRLAERLGLMYKDADAVTEKLSDSADGGTEIVLKQCAREYTVYAALYSDGSVSRVYVMNVGAGDGTKTFTVGAKYDELRLFMWDTRMRPLCRGGG